MATSTSSLSERAITITMKMHSVPKIKSLLLLRKLLLEVQGNLDNRKEFRKLMRALAQDLGEGLAEVAKDSKRSSKDVCEAARAAAVQMQARIMGVG